MPDDSFHTAMAIELRAIADEIAAAAARLAARRGTKASPGWAADERGNDL